MWEGLGIKLPLAVTLHLFYASMSRNVLVNTLVLGSAPQPVPSPKKL